VSRTIPRNTDGVIDSRDVIARIAELEAEQERIAENRAIVLSGEANSDRVTAFSDLEMDETEAAELVALRALQDEAEGYTPDWKYGTTLIRDDYFESYARDLAEDIGAIDRNAAWPLSYIDWPAAADALKQDYTSVDFDGVTYWVR